jgi:HNH endonuclease
MHCLFCKANSESSKSREHIIPESLGNKDHVLPSGWVCDSCNNYLARKVEAPFLETRYGTSSRFEMRIPNKKGRIPIGTGFHPQSRSMVDIMIDKNGWNIFAAQSEDESRFVNSVRTKNRGSLYIPSSGDPELNYETARFIGKVGLEILAYRCMDVEGWNDEVVNKIELDELRNYVRRGKPGFVWPINIRRIYPTDHEFLDKTDETFQVLHEWDILFIPSAQGDESVGEFYATIAILGIEYAINLGGPELDSYLQWLKDKDNQSYLYVSKKA